MRPEDLTFYKPKHPVTERQKEYYSVYVVYKNRYFVNFYPYREKAVGKVNFLDQQRSRSKYTSREALEKNYEQIKNKLTVKLFCLEFLNKLTQE